VLTLRPRCQFVSKAAIVMSGQDQATQALVLRSQCWNAALHAYGTGFIFERRAHIFKQRLNWLTYGSLGLPLAIGLLVLGYGEFKALKYLIPVVVAACAILTLLSLWSIIGGWVEGCSYANSAVSANHLLSEKYAVLGENPPRAFRSFQREYDKLGVEDKILQQQDYQQDIREEEKRMGMHAALRKFRRPCAECGQVPTTMTPSNCGVCGDYKYKGN
jgi:mobilome CxxCx(11)CxxC protein